MKGHAEIHPVKCLRCDILLDGREQFMGHMIHGHEMQVWEAEGEWISTCSKGLQCALG